MIRLLAFNPMTQEPHDEHEPTGTDLLTADVLAPVMPKRLRLSVISGPDQGTDLILTRGTYLVGKDPGCALVLSDGAVSRQHLEIAVIDGGVRVRDLNSSNGSLFQGARFQV